MAELFEPMYSGVVNESFASWEEENTISAISDVDKEALFQQELDALKQKAHDEGYAQGINDAENEMSLLKQQIKNILEVLQKPQSLITQELERSLIEVIYWMANACIHVTITQSEEALLSLFSVLKETLTAVEGKKHLALSKEDFEFLNKHSMTWEDDAGTLTLNIDETLARGDFYLRGENTEIDGRLARRLRTILANNLGIESWLSPHTEGMNEDESFNDDEQKP